MDFSHKALTEELQKINSDNLYKMIGDEQFKEINPALKGVDLSEIANRLHKYLEDIEKAPLNIAVTGESGSGKSTLINAIRGMGDEEEGSAPTGVVETTMKPIPYTHPEYTNVRFWDLPGIGTPNFAAAAYLESVQFHQYDFFIIMSSDRFKENDIVLAKEIQAMNKKFYFVRSKVDNDLHASQIRRKTTYNEEAILKEIRDNCINNLKDGGIAKPQVFLLSCLDLDKYDFHEMQETLEKELPEQKRHIFLISLPNISLKILEKKRESLKKYIWMWSTVSCAAAVVPIPGVSLACDVGILIKTMKDYMSAFGLDEQSLKKLANKCGKDVSELRSVMKSPVVKQEINKELVIKLLSKGVGGALILAEQGIRNIPVVGCMAAGGISFCTTYWMLYGFLKEIADDAVRVLTKALESPV